MYFHYYYCNIFLLLICTLLSISYTSAAISSSPSGHAFDQFRKMRALPKVAEHAELSIQTSSKIKPKGLITTLERYASPNLPNSEKEKLESVIDSVKFMGPDGSTKFFAIELADRNSKVKFVAVAVRMDQKGELLDYAIGTYSYQTPSRVRHVTAYLIDFWGIRWFQYQKKIVEPNPAIQGETRVQLEAAFMYELSRRDLLRVDDYTDNIELLPIGGPEKTEL